MKKRVLHEYETRSPTAREEKKEEEESLSDAGGVVIELYSESIGTGSNSHKRLAFNTGLKLKPKGSVFHSKRGNNHHHHVYAKRKPSSPPLGCKSPSEPHLRSSLMFSGAAAPPPPLRRMSNPTTTLLSRETENFSILYQLASIATLEQEKNRSGGESPTHSADDSSSSSSSLSPRRRKAQQGHNEENDPKAAVSKKRIKLNNKEQQHRPSVTSTVLSNPKIWPNPDSPDTIPTRGPANLLGKANVGLSSREIVVSNASNDDISAAYRKMSLLESQQSSIMHAYRTNGLTNVCMQQAMPTPVQSLLITASSTRPSLPSPPPPRPSPPPPTTTTTTTTTTSSPVKDGQRVSQYITRLLHPNRPSNHNDATHKRAIIYDRYDTYKSPSKALVPAVEYLDSKPENEKLKVLYCMTVGLSTGYDIDSDVVDHARGFKTALKPNKKQLLEEVRRRYNTFNLKATRTLKPNNEWNLDQIKKWLREHPITDSTDVTFLTLEVEKLKVAVQSNLETRSLSPKG